MTTITLITFIHAPIERCFDLARSIDLHLLSTAKTKERVVAGRTKGLAMKDDTITWEAVHFGFRQRLVSKITHMELPYYFRDEMQKGAFESMHHEHHFAISNGETAMTDIFCYKTPLGILGKLFDSIVLKSYMRTFLEERNTLIKNAAEDDGWINILK
jgi:ligand-binding SRPBCC domain-containing protein